MRLGTPSGLRTISAGVPSGRYGMSSSGTMRAMTPLFPWRPAILSPTESLRFMAIYTFNSLMKPGGSSSPLFALPNRRVGDLAQHVNLPRSHFLDLIDLLD